MAPLSRRWRAAAVVAAALVAPTPSSAQVVRERPVPLDTAGGVLTIDAELRRSLGLFPEVQGFRSARLFQLESGGAYVLEIELRDPEGPARERRALSPAEVTDLRARVSAAMGARGPAAFSTDGRAGLLLTSTALGLGFYGWAVPVALDLEERSAVAAYLLTAGTSFFLPYQVTRGRPVSRAQRNASVWAATRGGIYGLVLADALTEGEEPEPRFVDDDGDEDVILAGGMAASLLGGVLGYGYGGRPGVDEALVARRATAGDFALGWGFGTSVALGLYDGETYCEGDLCETSEFERRPGGQLGTLALGVAGTWAGGRWARARDHTVGDTRALRSFGLLGAQAVLPLAWGALEDTDEGERGVAAGMVLGSVAGFWVGDRVLRDRQLSSGSGLLVLAGHAAGGLGALGVTYLLDDSAEDHEVLYMATSALGSIVGSWLTLRAVGDVGSGEADGASDGRSLDVDLASLPTALLSLVGPAPDRRSDVPWVTLRF